MKKAKSLFFTSFTAFILSFFALQPTIAQSDPVIFQEFAQDLTRFPTQVQNSFIKNLSGKTLRFSNGTTYNLGDFIGAGETTAIFEIKETKPPKVIRIPFFYTDNGDEKTFINEFINGEHLLTKYKAPIVQIHDSYYDEYVVVDRLPKSSLDIEKLKRSSLDLKQKAAQALIKFSVEVSPFNDIGDFKLSQLHYDPDQNKWILADWTNNQNRAGHYPVLFDPEKPNDHFNNEIQRELLGALGLQNADNLEIKNIPNTLFEDLDIEERKEIAKELIKQQSAKRLEFLESQSFIADAAKHKRRHMRWQEDTNSLTKDLDASSKKTAKGKPRNILQNCVLILKKALGL